MSASSGLGDEASPIDAYLDELFARLPRQPRMRRVLAEAEDHLRESAAAGVAAGLAPADAERRAVQRFGPAERFAVTMRTRTSSRRIAFALFRAAWSLAAVGLVAVGASGLLVAGMNRIAGPGFVGGSRPSVPSMADCSRLLRIHPSALTCSRASVLETADDAVVLRLIAGAVGLLLLGVFLLVRRRGVDRTLPTSFVPTVAFCVFGFAAGGLLLTSAVSDPVGQSAGRGFFLSGGIVASVFAAGYGVLLLTRLRREPG